MILPILLGFPGGGDNQPLRAAAELQPAHPALHLQRCERPLRDAPVAARATLRDVGVAASLPGDDDQVEAVGRLPHRRLQRWNDLHLADGNRCQKRGLL